MLAHMHSGRCIFCGATGALTDEHVLSKPLRSLLGIQLDTPIEWNSGSPRLMAGGFAGQAANPQAVTIRCVCRACNNEWMSTLDSTFAGSIRWWANHPTSRLGDQRLRVIRRYLAKLLWVVRLGEDWATSAWIFGQGPEPEFIPLSIIQDGLAIRSVRPYRMEDLQLGLHIAAARVSPATTQLLHSPPVAVQGLQPTNKLRRINAALVLTLRRVGLRLWAVASSLDANWHAHWPSAVTSLTPSTQYRHLRQATLDLVGEPTLGYHGPPPPPNLEALYTSAFQLARQTLHAE